MNLEFTLLSSTSTNDGTGVTVETESETVATSTSHEAIDEDSDLCDSEDGHSPDDAILDVGDAPTDDGPFEPPFIIGEPEEEVPCEPPLPIKEPPLEVLPEEIEPDVSPDAEDDSSSPEDNLDDPIIAVEEATVENHSAAGLLIEGDSSANDLIVEEATGEVSASSDAETSEFALFANDNTEDSAENSVENSTNESFFASGESTTEVGDAANDDLADGGVDSVDPDFSNESPQLIPHFLLIEEPWTAVMPEPVPSIGTVQSIDSAFMNEVMAGVGGLDDSSSYGVLPETGVSF